MADGNRPEGSGQGRDLAAATEAFEAVRPHLHGVAYRMTGSIADADDLCQEAWLRWTRVDHGEVDDPEGFLVRVVTRLAIDRQRSAAVRRESYVGPYLPEPLVRPVGGRSPDDGVDPAHAAEVADSLTFAFLVVLDELDPVERAVVLLHDVFGYPFGEVAAAIGSSEAGARQTAVRARRKVAEGRPPSARPSDDRVEEVLAGLVVALAAGDIPRVMSYLAPGVVQLDDGGPKQHAARRPVVGSDRVARLWVNLAKRNTHLSVQMADVNGRPGLLLFDGDRPFMVSTVELDADGRVDRIFSQLNPDKLVHLAPESSTPDSAGGE